MYGQLWLHYYYFGFLNSRCTFQVYSFQLKHCWLVIFFRGQNWCFINLIRLVRMCEIDFTTIYKRRLFELQALISKLVSDDTSLELMLKLSSHFKLLGSLQIYKVCRPIRLWWIEKRDYLVLLPIKAIATCRHID